MSIAADDEAERRAFAAANRRQDDPLVRRTQEENLRAAWKPPAGWRYWSGVNNDMVGQWYTATSFVFMIFAGILALVVRVQLAAPESDLVSAEFYNQAFTLHGTAMIFLFAVPIFEAVAILLMPAVMGARDLPFPRLSAFGFWSFFIGGCFVCGSILFGVAPSGGWFMYPPLNTDTAQSGIGTDIWLLGLSFIEVASIAAAVELIVGVLKCRPPGMHMNLTPLYGWYVLIVAGMILFAFPPLIAGDLLFELERAFDWPFFDPTRGGDPLLWQHLFWIFGHPEVYIIFLPSIALLAMIVPTFAQRPMVGYSWIVLSAVGTGFLSFGLWVHHMFTTGMPSISLAFFSAASEAVAIPTGIQLFVFIATLLLGRVVRSTPLLYASGALAIFVLGGLTGVMVAVAPFDFQVHDTYFIVAHLHYTIFGGVVFPLLAGVYYFYPMVRKRLLSERLGRIAFWLLFAGFNVCFLPMHLTGMVGMPRRVYTYPAEMGWDWLNLISTVGAFVIAAGFAVFFTDFFFGRRWQREAGRNPWNAGTLEWVAEDGWGIRSVPVIETRYPPWHQKDFARKVWEGRFYLPDAEERKREAMITTVLDAEPLQCLRVLGPSWLPFWSAVFTGGFFIFATYHWWMLTLASAAAALACILAWLWTGTAVIPEKPRKDVGLGLQLRLYQSGPQSVGWWAMLITMIGDMTAFLSLVFGYFFFWTVHADFPPLDAGPAGVWAMLALVSTFGAWGATLMARNRNRNVREHEDPQGRILRAGSAGACRVWLVLGALLAIGAGASIFMSPWAAGMQPTAHVYPAIVWAIVVWNLIHLGIGVVMQCYCFARSLLRRMTPDHDIDVVNVALYWHFALFTMAVSVGVIAGFPLLSLPRVGG